MADRSASRASFAAWLAAGAVLGSSFIIDLSALSHVPVFCPFRLATDLPCPGCGLTRSFVAFSHGDLSAAFDYHAFGPLLFLVTSITLAWRSLELVTRRPLGLNHVGFRLRNLAAVICVAWVGWAIGRAICSVTHSDGIEYHESVRTLQEAHVEPRP
ncbi:MAG: DUF2752 domain-containing protein [Pirellulales bacterium]|nr:DUF2752 domain-containing protein [Pirellulales bacterium]